jgi:hypothetical protein
LMARRAIEHARMTATGGNAPGAGKNLRADFQAVARMASTEMLRSLVTVQVGR